MFINMFVCFFFRRDNSPPLFMTPSCNSLSYLGSLFFTLAARSGAFLMEHSNASALVFKEAKQAHAKSKTSLEVAVFQ